MIEVRSSSLIVVGERIFPITVDYCQRVGEAWDQARRHVKFWGNIELSGKEFPNAQLNRTGFVCRYATLQQDSRWDRLKALFESQSSQLADMMQLFAFICSYVRTEVTAQNPSPIVAASPCSTWKCSHDILLEMAGVEWDPWHHDPGPILHTVAEYPQEGFEKGTRFLIFECPA